MTARYRILRRLGAGGMAEVFEAELAGELGFSRKVAIKRMLGDAALGGAAQRFLDEARIASKLHHANVVGVLDVGLLDGLPFQVLELVDGITAQQLAKRAGGTLPLPIALMIAADVAHALDHAHSARDDAGLSLGIVHRDVKPANVLVSWTGDVKLADFGIAVARDREAQTETGVVAGTAGFIAPEQRTRSEIDGRTDVFALGLTLHALATGYTPLKELSVEVAVLGGVPIPLDPTLPDDIRAMIASAVAPRRIDRPTAAQLADAIGAALAPRLTRDARGYLREFLARFQSTQARPGALDHLLGVEVVLTSAPADAPAQYSLRPTQAARPDGIPTRPLGELEVATTERAPARRSRRGIVVVAVLAVAAGGGVASQLGGGDDGARSDVAMSSRDGARSDPALSPQPPVRGDTPGSTPRPVLVDKQPVVVDKQPVVVETPPVAPARASPAPKHEPHRAPPDAAPASMPVGSGWLQAVGAESLIGSRVVIDGKDAGFVPNPIEVQQGHHSVELVTRDGTRLPAHAVDVSAFHTQARPLKTSW